MRSSSIPPGEQRFNTRPLVNALEFSISGNYNAASGINGSDCRTTVYFHRWMLLRSLTTSGDNNTATGASALLWQQCRFGTGVSSTATFSGALWQYHRQLQRGRRCPKALFSSTAGIRQHWRTAIIRSAKNTTGFNNTATGS